MEQNVIYLNGQKDLLDSQRASGSENLQTLHERRDALIRERDALEEKRFAGLDLAGMQERLVELSARYDEMAKDGVGGVDTTEIDRRLQELHRKLGQRGAEQYAPKYTRHIAEVAAKVKELGAKYTREAALLKGFQPGVVCPTCRRAVSRRIWALCRPGSGRPWKRSRRRAGGAERTAGRAAGAGKAGRGNFPAISEGRCDAD